MDLQSAIADCKHLESECRLLADAFRPGASAGHTIIIPIAMAKQLAELLELCTGTMRHMASEGIGLTETGFDGAMIERVAEAIAIAQSSHWDCVSEDGDRCGYLGKNDYRVMARAAIEVMRPK